jgi:hypothetical protein
MTARFDAMALGLTFAAFAAAAPAHAQCRLCERPATSRPSESSQGAISLEIEAALDFDRLILLQPGPGSATLRPDRSTSVSGTIAAISGRAMVGQASVRGEPGRAVRIELPSRIALYSLSGGRIAIDDIISDLPPMPRLDASGRLSFRFGGRLNVTGDSEGQYRGDVPITVEYL